MSEHATSSGNPPLPKQWLGVLLRCAILLAMLLGVGYRVRTETEKLSSYEFQLAPGMLVVSGLLYAAGLATCAAFWRMAIRDSDSEPGWVATLAAYYAGHLGKYVPGKGLVVVVRAGMLKEAGVSVVASAITCVHETILMMATGAAVATGILLVTPTAHHKLLLVLGGVLAITLGALALPPVVYRVGTLVTRTLPLADKTVRPCRWQTVGFGVAMIAGGWVLLGMSLAALLVAMGQPPSRFEEWRLLTAAVALATVGGFVIPTPGGLGTREWILFEVLRPVTGPDHAVVAAVTLRIVWLAAELVMAGLFWLLLRNSGGRWTRRSSRTD